MDLQAIKRRYGIIGNSTGLNTALGVAMRVAPTDLTVLILGESGVGKEVFSQIIHALSPRKHSQFIAVNCGAIPEGTIDSELFGHEKGAFTGATDNRKGYFEVVDSGTIFLDEVGEMPLGTQARLLRILESGEFIKVGSSKVLKSNVRIVAATNVDLLEAVQRGKFREDLYYRLNTVPIAIPALRKRKGDIYLLFRKFTLDFSERNRISPISLNENARKLLENYNWPGNIRELKNIAEQISVLATERVIDEETLLGFLPQAQTTLSRFPVLSSSGKNNDNNFSEREIMYKMLFDMKNDLTDLKQIMFQLIQNGTLNPDILTGTKLGNYIPNAATATSASTHTFGSKNGNNSNLHINDNNTAIVLRSQHSDVNNYLNINQNNHNIVREDDDNYNTAEVIEESLSIATKEKELIQKALKKHKGKRKDAAKDLGISERTLYRKIKEYEILEN